MTLTPREKQVCAMVVRGLTSMEMAMSLGLSHRTIEDYRLGVMRKYGVRNAVELTRAVFKIGETA